MNIHLTPEQIALVTDILEKYLKDTGAKVLAFGSRVKFTDTPQSDLDLAVYLSTPVSLQVLEALREDFEQSMLPFRVDIIDLSQVSERIKTSILAEPIVFWENKNSQNQNREGKIDYK